VVWWIPGKPGDLVWCPASPGDPARGILGMERRKDFQRSPGLSWNPGSVPSCHAIPSGDSGSRGMLVFLPVWFALVWQSKHVILCQTTRRWTVFCFGANCVPSLFHRQLKNAATNAYALR